MESLHLAATPYHILLNISIALGLHESSELIIQPNFRNSKKLIGALRKSAHPFSKITVLANTSAKKNKYVAVLGKAANYWMSVYISRKRNPGTVYVSNELKSPAQGVIQWSPGKSKVVHLEDGLFDYSDVSWGISERSKKLKKLTHGLWYNHQDVPASSETIDGIMCTHPNLLRKDINRTDTKYVSPLNLSNFIRGIQIWSDEYLECTKDKVLKKTYDTLIIPPLLKTENDINELRRYLERIKRGKSYTPKIIINFHPRQESVSEIFDCDTVSERIPAEFFILNEGLSSVYGYHTTAIKSFLWARSDIDTYLIGAASRQSLLTRKLQKLGCIVT